MVRYILKYSCCELISLTCLHPELNGSGFWWAKVNVHLIRNYLNIVYLLLLLASQRFSEDLLIDIVVVLLHLRAIHSDRDGKIMYCTCSQFQSQVLITINKTVYILIQLIITRSQIRLFCMLFTRYPSVL